MAARIYRMRFKDMDNADWLVQILNDDDTAEDDFYDLIPSSEPVVWEQDSDEDQQKTLRASTGNISFVCMDRDVIGDLQPTSLKSRPVTISCTSKEIEWHGYLSPETYTQEWDRPPYVLTLPIVSRLGIARNITFDHENDLSSTWTAYDVIKACLRLLTYDNTYTGTIYTNQEKGTVASLGAWGKNPIALPWLFQLETNEFGVQELVTPTVEDVLHKILAPFGCISEVGNDIYVEGPAVGISNIIRNAVSGARVTTRLATALTGVAGDGNNESRTSGIHKYTESFSDDSAIKPIEFMRDACTDINEEKQYFDSTDDKVWYLDCQSRQTNITLHNAAGHYSKFILTEPSDPASLEYPIGISHLGLHIAMHNENTTWDGSVAKRSIDAVTFRSIIPFAAMKFNTTAALAIKLKILWHDGKTWKSHQAFPQMAFYYPKLKVGKYYLTSLYNAKTEAESSETWTHESAVQSGEPDRFQAGTFDDSGNFTSASLYGNNVYWNNLYNRDTNELVIPLRNHPDFAMANSGYIMEPIEFTIPYIIGNGAAFKKALIQDLKIELVTNTDIPHIYDKQYSLERKSETVTPYAGEEVDVRYQTRYVTNNTNITHVHNYQPISNFSQVGGLKTKPLRIIELDRIKITATLSDQLIGKLFLINNVVYRILSWGCNSRQATFKFKLIEV